MEIAPFQLERWFDRYEADADIMLAESGIRSLDADRFDLSAGELGYVIPTDGDPRLRGVIAERYDRATEEVVLTCGTQEANFLAFFSILDPTAHAVVVTPTYQSLKSLPEWISEVTPVATNPPDWGLDLDAVAEATTDATDAIVLVNPANPVGRYYDESVLSGLYDIAVEHDAYLLVDEVYRLLAERPHPPAASLGPYAVSTAGISKAYGLAGARIGWLVAEPSIADRARRWKDYTTISPSTLGQHIAAQALGELEADILEENRSLAARNRDLVSSFLDEHGMTWYEPAGVAGFPTIPPNADGARSFCESLIESESVVLAPGEFFGHPDRLRIGFGTATDILEEGLTRVARHIDGR